MGCSGTSLELIIGSAVDCGECGSVSDVNSPHGFLLMLVQDILRARIGVNRHVSMYKTVLRLGSTESFESTLRPLCKRELWLGWLRYIRYTRSRTGNDADGADGCVLDGDRQAMG